MPAMTRNADNPQGDRAYRKEEAPLGDGTKMLPAAGGIPIPGPSGHGNHLEDLLKQIGAISNEFRGMWMLLAQGHTLRTAGLYSSPEVSRTRS